MRCRFPFCLILFLCLVSRAVAADPIKIANVKREEPVSFEKDILPLMRRSCLACHSASERQGELVLESPSSMRKGGDSGPALIPGRGADSLMLKLAAHQDDPKMPPPGNDVKATNLTPAELGLLRLWIDQGARGGNGVTSLSPGKWQALPSRIGPVYAVAASEDGQIVAASRANRLYLYHVPTGRLIAQLSDPKLADDKGKPFGVAHRDLVQALSFNRDGDLLASGSFREVKLWRRPSDVQRQTLATTGPVSAACVSPNGKVIVTAIANDIQLWSESGKKRQLLKGHTGTVTSVAASADNKTLVSASEDGTIRIWHLQEGKQLGMAEIGGKLRSVELVNATAPTKKMPYPPQMVVTGGDDRLIRTLHLPERPKRIHPIKGTAQYATLTSDGHTVALLGTDGTIQLLQRKQDGWTKLADQVTKLPNLATLAASLPGADSAERLKNGRLFLVTKAGSINVWSFAQQRVTSKWSTDNPIRSIAVAANGQQLVTGHEKGQVNQWSLIDEDTPKWEKASGSPVTLVARSPSGELIAAVSKQADKQVITVRNSATGQVTNELASHSGNILTIAFSTDSNKLISGSETGEIFIWSLADKESKPLKMPKQDGAVNSVCLAADNNIAYAAVGNIIRMWKLGDGKPIHELKGHTASISFVGIGSDSHPFSLAGDNTVRIWSSTTGKQTRMFTLPMKTTAVDLSVDRQVLAIAGEDRQVRIVQLANGQSLLTLPAVDDKQRVEQVRFSLDRKQLATSFRIAEGGLATSIWSLSTNPPTLHETQHLTEATQVLPGTKSEKLLMANTVGEWRQINRRLIRTLPGLTKPIIRVAYAGKDQTVVVLAEDGNFRGFNATNGQSRFSTAHGSTAADVAISADGQLFATAGANKVVRLWQANGSPFSTSQINNLPAAASRVAFSSNGQQIIIATADNKVSIYDRATSRLVERMGLHQNTPLLMVPGQSPESREVLSVSSEAAWSWRVHGIKTFPGHSGTITSLAKLPSAAQQIVSASLDGTARVWNLQSGQIVRTFTHGGPIVAVAVRPDGQRIATASENKTARIWNINGQSVAQLKGDLRSTTLVARLTQQQQAANSRVNLAKQQWDAAKKDAPAKMAAEKTAAETLAKANKEVTDKQAALDKVAAVKIAAEKLAIEASAKARSAQVAKLEAEAQVQSATENVAMKQTRSTQLTALASASPKDDSLKKQLDQAKADLIATQNELQQKQKTVPELTKALQAAVKVANEATQKATQQQKPYNDARGALETARSAQNLASQQHVIAARELKAAQEAEPKANAKHELLQAAMEAVKAELGKAKLTATAAELPIRSIAFSPDGTVLATAGDFTSAHMWDAEKGTPLAAYAGHSQPLSAVFFLDNERLFTAAADKTARVWELNPRWRLEKTLGGVDQPATFAHRILALDFSGDGSSLLAGGGVPSRNGELSIFEVATGKRTLHLPKAHDDVIHAAKFSPDGKRVASAGADKYARSFDIASSQQLRRFEGHTNYVLGLAWKGDGQTLASSAADNSIKIWDAETGDQRRTISNFNKHVTSVSFVGETGTIVSSSGDRSVRMHNSVNGGNVRSFSGPRSWVHCVDIIGNRTVLAAGTATGMLHIWNGTNGQVLQRINVGEVKEN